MGQGTHERLVVANRVVLEPIKERPVRLTRQEEAPMPNTYDVKILLAQKILVQVELLQVTARRWPPSLSADAVRRDGSWPTNAIIPPRLANTSG